MFSRLLGVGWPAMHGMWAYWAPPSERGKLAGFSFAGRCLVTCCICNEVTSRLYKRLYSLKIVKLCVISTSTSGVHTATRRQLRLSFIIATMTFDPLFGIGGIGPQL